MYNESGVIAKTAKTLSDYMEAHFSDYEILFADDGSTDGCGDLVRELHLPHVKVVGGLPNRGKGHAVRLAMTAADGDIRIFTDADLAYGTDVISRIVSTFEQTGADMVIGSRTLDKDGYAGYTTMRRVASKLYLRILASVGGFALSDSQCGCKAYSGAAAKAIFDRCTVDGFAFDFETILWANKLGYRIAEMPVRVLCHGESKIHMVSDSLRMLMDLYHIKKRIRAEK